MSKSKYSKTKAAGLMCGMSRYKNYKFAQAGVGMVQAENRQIKRMRKKK